MLASQKNGTIYIGVTNDLIRRVGEHRLDVVDGFTKTYGVHRLVHFDMFEDPRSAIQREKNLKRWPRAWKVALIEEKNPQWSDLYDGIARG
ncbi:MAG TPA: GIY-YIG nuclease family protein [Alphaproteobacteria bacterium]